VPTVAGPLALVAPFVVSGPFKLLGFSVIPRSGNFEFNYE